MDEADRRQVFTSANQLGDLVGRRTLLLTSRGEFATRQYGAAGLVRGCGLMRAAIACTEAGQDEAVGVLSRAVLESWLSGSFVMFGGPEALARLERERQRYEKNLIESNQINAADLVDERKTEIDAVARSYGLLLDERGEPRFGRLPVEQVAKELAPLIEAATGREEDTVALYNAMYRAYSTFDTHGIYPLERQLDLDDLTCISVRKAEPWLDAWGSIAIDCLVLAKLAYWVFGSFVIGTKEIERIYSVVGDVLTRSGVLALEQATQQVLDALPPTWTSRSSEVSS